jgi:hypothetical protein
MVLLMYLSLAVNSVGCKVIHISVVLQSGMSPVWLFPSAAIQFHFWKNHFGIMNYFSPDLEVKLLLSSREVRGHNSGSC